MMHPDAKVILYLTGSLANPRRMTGVLLSSFLSFIGRPPTQRNSASASRGEKMGEQMGEQSTPCES